MHNVMFCYVIACSLQIFSARPPQLAGYGNSSYTLPIVCFYGHLHCLTQSTTKVYMWKCLINLS